MLERLKDPILDPLTGQPLFLSEVKGGMETRRSKAATAIFGDIEMGANKGRKPKN
jgi:hypothetical protein